MSKCDSCSHSEVCKHKEEFINLEGKLPVTQSPFVSEVKCSKYREGIMGYPKDYLTEKYGNQSGPHYK